MLTDVAVSLRVQYTDKQTRFLVTSSRAIRSHYARSWLLADLFMAVPSAVIGHRWVYTVRLVRLLKAEKYQLNKRLEKVVHPSMVRLMNLLASFCLSVHLLASIYW